MDASVDSMEARVGEDTANVGIGSKRPHHRLASLEGAEHGVSDGGGGAVSHAA